MYWMHSFCNAVTEKERSLKISYLGANFEDPFIAEDLSFSSKPEITCYPLKARPSRGLLWSVWLRSQLRRTSNWKGTVSMNLKASAFLVGLEVEQQVCMS